MPHNFCKDALFHKWIYGNPQAYDKKRIAAFNSWLKAHEEEECELYHGTDAKLPILQQGLIKTTARTKKSYQSQTGYVYLSIYPETAKLFGEIAYPGSRISVYAVVLKIKELLPDPDQLKNKKYWCGLSYLGNTLAESLCAGSGARVKRNVFPYELKLIK